MKEMKEMKATRGQESRHGRRRDDITPQLTPWEVREKKIGLFASGERRSSVLGENEAATQDGEDKFAYLTRIFIYPDCPYRRYRNRQKSA